jgi:hypothetical protein
MWAFVYTSLTARRFCAGIVDRILPDEKKVLKMTVRDASNSTHLLCRDGRTLSGNTNLSSVQENRTENDLTYFTVPDPNEGSSHRAHTLPVSKVRRELNDAAHLWNDTFIPSFAVLEMPRA